MQSLGEIKYFNTQWVYKISLTLVKYYVLLILNTS